jgi:hypothetical protein
MKFPKIQAQLLFLGICMMLMNVGSRYIIDEFSQKEEEYQRNIFLRRVAIFAVCYMGTRDLVHALLLTAGFVVMAMGISRTHPNEGFVEGETPPPIGQLPSMPKKGGGPPPNTLGLSSKTPSMPFQEENGPAPVK